MSEHRVRLTYVQASDGHFIVAPIPRSPVPIMGLEESALEQETTEATSSEHAPEHSHGHNPHTTSDGNSDFDFSDIAISLPVSLQRQYFEQAALLNSEQISQDSHSRAHSDPSLRGGPFYFPSDEGSDDLGSSEKTHSPAPSSDRTASASTDLPLLTRTTRATSITRNHLHRCHRRPVITASPSSSQQSTPAPDTVVESGSSGDRQVSAQPGEVPPILFPPPTRHSASHGTEPEYEELSVFAPPATPVGLGRQHPGLPASIQPLGTNAHALETGFVEVSLAVLLSYTASRSAAGEIPDCIQVYCNTDGLPVWIRTDHIRRIWAVEQPELALRCSLQVSDDDRTYTWLPSIHLAREASPPSQLEVTRVSSPEASLHASPTPSPSLSLHVLKSSARKTVTSLPQNIHPNIPQRSSSLRSRRAASKPEVGASLERRRHQGTLHSIIESDEGHIVMEDHTSSPLTGSILPLQGSSTERSLAAPARSHDAGSAYPPRSSSVGTPLYNLATTSAYPLSAPPVPPRAPERLVRNRPITAASDEEEPEDGDGDGDSDGAIDVSIHEGGLAEEVILPAKQDDAHFMKRRAQHIANVLSHGPMTPTSRLRRAPTRASPVRVITSESGHGFPIRLEDWAEVPSPASKSSRGAFLWLTSEQHGICRLSPDGISTFHDLDEALRRRLSVESDERVLTLWTGNGTWIDPSQLKAFLIQRPRMTFSFDAAVTVIASNNKNLLGAWPVALTMPIGALRSHIFKAYAERMDHKPASSSEVNMMGYTANAWLDDGKLVSNYTSGAVLKIGLFRDLDSMKAEKAKRDKKAPADGPSSVPVLPRHTAAPPRDDYDHWSSTGLISDLGHVCSFDQVFKTTITDIKGEVVRHIPGDLNFSFRQSALWIEEFDTVNIPITFKLQPGVIASEAQNMHCLVRNMSSKTVAADLVHAVCMFLHDLDHKMKPPSTDADAVQISLSLGKKRLFNPASLWDYFDRKAEHIHIDVWERRHAEDLWEDPGTFDRALLHPRAVGAFFEPRTKDHAPDTKQFEAGLFTWIYAGRLASDTPFWQYPRTRKVMIKVFAGRDWEKQWDPRQDCVANQSMIKILECVNIEAGIKAVELRKLLWEGVSGTAMQKEVWADFPSTPEGLLLYVFSNLHPISMEPDMTLQHACGLPAWNNVIIVLRPLNRPRVHLRQIPLELEIIPEPWMEESPVGEVEGEKTAFRRKMRAMFKFGKGRKREGAKEDVGAGPGPSKSKADEKTTKGREKKRGFGFFRRAKDKLSMPDESSELVIRGLGGYGLMKD